MEKSERSFDLLNMLLVVLKIRGKMGKVFIGAWILVWLICSMAVRAMANGTEYSDMITGYPVVIYMVQASDLSGRFIDPLPQATWHRSVILRLYNVNTFRNKYTIKFQTTDYHTASPPQGVSGLFSISNPVTVPFTPNKQPIEISDEELKNAYNAYKNSFNSFTTQILSLPGLLRKLIDIIQTKRTNIEIRSAAANEVQSYILEYNKNFKTVGPEPISECEVKSSASGDQPAPAYLVNDYPQGVLDPYLKELPTLTEPNDSFQKLNVALQAWQTLYMKKKSSLQDPDKTNASAANDEIAGLQNSIPTDSVKHILPDSFTSAAEGVRTLFAEIIDTVQAPPCISKIIRSAAGDEMSLEVDLDYIPLITAQADGVDPKTLPALSTTQVATHIDTAFVKVYGRPVIDYSAGFVATNLLNKNFSGTPGLDNKGNTITIVTQGNSDARDASVAGMAHFYRTTSHPLTFGGGLGIAANGTTTSRYLAGLDVVVQSNRNRFFLSYGVALGKVNVLSNNDVVGRPASTGSVKTDSVLRFGRFLGFSANLAF